MHNKLKSTERGFFFFLRGGDEEMKNNSLERTKSWMGVNKEIKQGIKE